jgi:integrase
MNSRELYDGFITRKRASGLSPRTIEAYDYAILPFIQLYPDLPVSPEKIETYIYQNGWSQQKRAFVFRHLRAFCRWYSRKLKEDNPMFDVIKPRIKLDTVRYLTKDEIQRLYMEVSTNKRDKAIILTLLDTGIRVGELLSIKLSSLDTDILQVTGKTGPRIVPISPTVTQLLKEIALPSGEIFGITKSRIYRIISYYLTKIGFDGKKGPHTFRHTFAVHALRNGMDIVTVSKTMGHKTIVQTQQYLRLAQEDMTEAHTRFSPLNLITDTPGRVFENATNQ